MHEFFLGLMMSSIFSSLAYCPHSPTPKQQEFLSLNCKEALYGGSAGGGKSDALLMAALQYTFVPGYSAILFRKTYQDLALPGALISRSHEWLDATDAKWDGTNKCWLFPSGAKLTFGYLDSLLDQYRYQSAEFQFVGFDELTQFEESKYLYLFSRLRATRGIKVPLRMRGATNPGGVGHAWVRRRFVKASSRSEGAAFISAKVQDNPHLNVEEYINSLMYLDSTTRERYLNGDWEITDDNVLVYSCFDPDKHVGVSPHGERQEMYRNIVMGIDPGTRDPYAIGVWGRDWDGNWWGLDELYLTGQTSMSLGPTIKSMCEKWGVSKVWVDKRKPSDIQDLRSMGINALPNLDIHAENARDTIRPMIGVVLDLFKAGKVKLAPSMRWHKIELERYRYKDADDRNAGEVPIDKDNHACDEMRYAICSVEEVPQMRPRYRSGNDLVPREPKTNLERRDPRLPVSVIPDASAQINAQFKRWQDGLKPGRRQR